MAITSSAFSRVKLTDEDAQKFERQVRYGRSNAQALASVREGRKLATAFFASNGGVLTSPKKR